MKAILTILLLFISFQGFNQITIKGVKESKIITDNKEKGEVKEIKNVNFTQTKEDEYKPTYVTKNTIKDTRVKTNNNKVEVTIIDAESAKELEDDRTNQIVISLDKAKNTIDSISNNPGNQNTNQLDPVKKPSLATNFSKETTRAATTEEKPKQTSLIYKNDVQDKKQTIAFTNVTTESQKNATTNTTVNTSTAPIKVVNNNTVKTEPTNQAVKTEPVIVQTNQNTTSTQNTMTTTNSVENLTQINNSNSNPKKGSWSMSLRAGLPIIIGDVKSKTGFGTSLSIQKALGHSFSLRLQALFLETYGLNTDLNTYQNYKTRFSDYTLQGVFSFNNLNFYNKEPKVLYNLILGGGLATRYTWTDLKDANGLMYDYTNISNTDASATKTDLLALLDKKHETHIAKDEDKMSIKNTNVLPTILFGLGIDFKISEKIDFNVETRLSNHFDDNLDGYKNGNNSDWMSFTSLGLSYKFASKSKSLRWSNPYFSTNTENQTKINTQDNLKVENTNTVLTPKESPVQSPQVAQNTKVTSTETVAKVNTSNTSSNINTASKVETTDNSISSENDFGQIFFEENSYRIHKDYYATMFLISRYIQANPDSKIEITSYTDALSNEKYNESLAEKRANAVYSLFIQEFKVPANNLTTNFVRNTTSTTAELKPANYLNRRVEFTIKK